MTTVEFEGLEDDYIEVTDWPAFILWAKVSVRHRGVVDADAGNDSVFVSLLSAEVKPILEFDVNQQILTLNTTSTNQSDEFLGQSVLGFHPFAEYGITAYRRMRTLSPTDPLDSRVCVTVAWVAKNDYAGAYDNPEWWKGHRWEQACGRGGSPFLSGYGAYPDETGDSDGGDAGSEDEGYTEPPSEPVPEDPPPPPEPDDDVITDFDGSMSFGHLTTETRSDLVTSSFQRISTYPVLDDGDY